jgi:anti-anti-sigma factor
VPDFSVDVRTEDDGSLVVRPSGIVGAECAVTLRQVLVHAVRRTRPCRLFLDLGGVDEFDSINLGTVAAICDLAGDHQVAVFVVNSPDAIAARLLAAGVAPRHLQIAPYPIRHRITVS